MDWFPHHLADYDGDTMDLTAFEDGVYHRLLRWYYQNEQPLPSGDVALAGIARIGLSEWVAIGDKIRAFFVTRDNRVTGERRLFHKRCNEVIQAQNKKRKDGKTRQEKLRKNGMLEPVTRLSRVSNAPRVEERRLSETESVATPSPATSTEPADISGPPASKDEKAAKPKPARMLPSWKPEPDDVAYAEERGLTGQALDDETANFVHHFTNGKGARDARADWSLSFKTWIRNCAKFDRGSGAAANGHSLSPARGNGSPGSLSAVVGKILAEDRARDDIARSAMAGRDARELPAVVPRPRPRPLVD